MNNTYSTQAQNHRAISSRDCENEGILSKIIEYRDQREGILKWGDVSSSQEQMIPQGENCMFLIVSVRLQIPGKLE